jgi:His/Glu/Gln/Arg/opine family amino acid ABC transporter permease subunit
MFRADLFTWDFLSILTAVPTTLAMACVILAAGILLGTFLAVLRLYRVPVFGKIVPLFVSYIRGIPLIVHLYIAWYALAAIFKNTSLSPLFVLLVAYSIYSSAIQSENIRTALLSVDDGQFEAAYSVGFTKFQTLRRIVFPQALAVAVPIFFNMYLGTIKGLSLAFTVAVVDILAQAKICSAKNYGFLESYAAAALVYWALCAFLTVGFSRLEQHFSRGRR